MERPSFLKASHLSAFYSSLWTGLNEANTTAAVALPTHAGGCSSVRRSVKASWWERDPLR
ncbi:hypothetical protein IQ26_04753 [Mesorhizobium tianshanense]|uniref:Uncharacterized protein n=1 Tax=Mesorhizobium tianshanense TaxID=39844 RepID=A0A562NFL9_9HYPH|nr:hypothetical protein IQ26_04753 [Mesorhizobium tianshanense]